jgi:prophage antirepressor-like protein
MKTKEIERIFDGNRVRVFMKNETPWFVLVDVCKVLGLTNPTEMARNIDDDDLSKSEGTDSIGRRTMFTMINESGLYALIFRSRKESARAFKRWITSEVLPSIRRTGSYSIPGQLRKLSTKNRNAMTEAWKECGVDKPQEYAMLTVAEYRALQFENGKRKKDMNAEEIKLLSALEALETLNLHYNPVDGFIECKSSIDQTARAVQSIAGPK